VASNTTFPKLLAVFFILTGLFLLNSCAAGAVLEVNRGANTTGADNGAVCPVPTELARVPGSEVGVGVDHEAVPLFPGTVRVEFIEAPE